MGEFAVPAGTRPMRKAYERRAVAPATDDLGSNPFLQLPSFQARRHARMRCACFRDIFDRALESAAILRELTDDEVSPVATEVPIEICMA